VDDAARPIEQLEALLELHSLIFEQPCPDDWVAVQGQIGRAFQRVLRRAGTYDGPISGEADPRTLRALGALMEGENMGDRFRQSDGLIDRQAATFLLGKLGPTAPRGGD
jgi:hypothetical protein